MPPDSSYTNNEILSEINNEAENIKILNNNPKITEYTDKILDWVETLRAKLKENNANTSN